MQEIRVHGFVEGQDPASLAWASVLASALAAGLVVLALEQQPVAKVDSLVAPLESCHDRSKLVHEHG